MGEMPSAQEHVRVEWGALHVDEERFTNTIAEAVASAQQSGVRFVIVPSIALEVPGADEG